MAQKNKAAPKSSRPAKAVVAKKGMKKVEVKKSVATKPVAAKKLTSKPAAKPAPPATSKAKPVVSDTRKKPSASVTAAAPSVAKVSPPAAGKPAMPSKAPAASAKPGIAAKAPQAKPGPAAAMAKAMAPAAARPVQAAAAHVVKPFVVAKGPVVAAPAPAPGRGVQPVAAKPGQKFAPPMTPKELAEKAQAARQQLTAQTAQAAAAQKKPVSQRHGFKTNEHIVYPAHGVGRIVAIEEQEIAGMSLELFVITFDKDKMTLRVPTGKLQSVGMRKLSEENVVKKAMETLKGRARVKRTMWSRRAQEYEAKINSGDLVSIAEVVRDLYRSEQQPEQSYSERQLYEAALDRMAREIAAVEKTDERGAVQRITEVLSKSAKGRRLAAEGAAAEEAEGAEAA